MSALDVLPVRTNIPPVASSATLRSNAPRLTQEEADAIRRWVGEHPELSLQFCVAHLQDVYDMHPSALYAVLRNDTWHDASYVPRQALATPTPSEPLPAAQSLEPTTQRSQVVQFPAANLKRGETPDQAQQRVIREYLAASVPDRKVAV